jgi:hypothetical protein
MTRREREEEILLLVQEMERMPWAYPAGYARAAASAYDTLKRLPEGTPFDVQELVIRRLHGAVTLPVGLAIAGGYFVVGLLLTSPLWWKAGR